ncbi:DUF1289 domain-containing protein [Agrobacterium larrymoorei]|uniref:DUF1289 domain-containing protein n=1 Tax=Agrobacterium larrymoorei TaxID=160699 RepID=UPI001571828A|nr:DUF1289 domain-containing protein [Agrobacterium larrymoorei]NTJ42614.1 DUF1289 domain-containing protein [Agrobacterium larrymoorei]
METPCIHVCLLDDDTGLCVGCHRSIQEIMGWAAYSDAERQKIMLDLPGRMNAQCHHSENVSA